MFGPLTEYSEAARLFKNDVPEALYIDARCFAHAGMVALMRLTGSDKLMERLRPRIVAYADDAEFRRMFAIQSMERGASYVGMSREFYWATLNGIADEMLKNAGAA